MQQLGVQRGEVEVHEKQACQEITAKTVHSGSRTERQAFHMSGSYSGFLRIAGASYSR